MAQDTSAVTPHIAVVIPAADITAIAVRRDITAQRPTAHPAVRAVRHPAAFTARLPQAARP